MKRKNKETKSKANQLLRSWQGIGYADCAKAKAKWNVAMDAYSHGGMAMIEALNAGDLDAIETLVLERMNAQRGQSLEEMVNEANALDYAADTKARQAFVEALGLGK